MTDEQTKEIRRRLDEDLSLDDFERDYRSTGEAATQFFQDLFVQVLNFEETTSPLGDATWQDIPVHEWPNTTRANSARLFAESGNFRIIYVELEKLTRTAERNAIQSLTRSDRTSGWAIDGSFLTVFHAPDEDVWHLVTPYEEGTDDITTGRPVLRRYTLGEGETHRTVADALSSMDASKGRLAERIDEAFRVKPVTEDFYENYKSAFDTLSKELRQKELRQKGLEIEDADRYAHMTLNRLMFFYYLQKKGWIGDRKDFVRWFHEQYEESDDESVFHERWLSALFFDGMNSPEGGEIDVDLPPSVESAVAGLPYMNGGLFQPTEEDECDTYLSDSALKSVIEEFLEQYNFTVTEESPYDIDVAVDPAMLGKIYESLIAEQERGEAGIFYTPRIEVDLMCRMALYEQFCERAGDLNAEEKQQVIEFIFSKYQDWNSKGVGPTETLEEILHDLRIVDPACGSGAFLVGMKQVLVELYRKLGITPDYHLKEQIINENLYGVDIKDWAVRVAEFRLWLSLVEGESEIPDERPVLPNFSFKLKCGDSVIQTIDGEAVSMESIEAVDNKTGTFLNELEDLKGRYYKGEVNDEGEIRNQQTKILDSYIDARITGLESTRSQASLSGEITESAAENKQERQQRIQRLKKLRKKLNDATSNDIFFWELDFAEVMLAGGFDIVISNPPYVRQEDIIDQSISPERLEQMDDGVVRDEKDRYKTQLRDYVENRFDIKPYKRSDIYVYFFFKGLDVLRTGGTLAYVTSNSWLDVNYGRRLQEGLLKYGELRHIFNNRTTRTFDEADVNTVVTIANRSDEQRLGGDAAFTTFAQPYNRVLDEAAFDDILIRPVQESDGNDISEINVKSEEMDVQNRGEFRAVSISEAALWRLGGGMVEPFSDDEGVPRPSGKYSEGGWGMFVRAPDVYFEILDEFGDLFTQVDEVADVRRGITSGANDFFYLPTPGEENKFFNAEFDHGRGRLQLLLKNSETKDEFRAQGYTVSSPMFEIEAEYVMHKTDISADEATSRFPFHYETDGDVWAPNLLIKSPKATNGLAVETSEVTKVVFRATESKSKLGDGARDYVDWGETWEPSRGSKFAERRTCTARTPWYNVGEKEVADVLFPRRIWSAFSAPQNDPHVLDNDSLFGLQTEDPERLCYILNSSITWLFLEINARSSLGQGVLDTDVNMLEEQLIPDPSILANTPDTDIKGPDGLYEQFRTEDPEEIELEYITDPRKTVDDAVLTAGLEMPDELRKRLCQALTEIVNARIEKSQT